MEENMMRRWLFGLGLSLLPFPATAADFFIHFDRCTSVVGYLVVSDQNLKVLAGDPVALLCQRSGRQVQCRLEHPDPSRGPWGKQVSYKVTLDSPPFLTFSDARWADYVMVDTNARAATLNTRISDPQYMGSKVCTGIYLTEDDLKATGKEKSQGLRRRK
jgi:hypothetical protein